VTDDAFAAIIGDSTHGDDEEVNDSTFDPQSKLCSIRGHEKVGSEMAGFHVCG
jgi:hypothetical protein